MPEGLNPDVNGESFKANDNIADSDIPQNPRIPQIDRSEQDYQTTRTVNEGYITRTDIEPTRAQAAWVDSMNQLTQLQDRFQGINAAKSLINTARKELNRDRLLEAGENLLTNPRSGRAFDQLITNYAQRTGELESLVASTDPDVHSNPGDAMREAIFGPRKSADFQPGDIYRFARVFLDKKTSQALRIQLVELHARGLNYASNRVSGEQRTLDKDFSASLDSAVETGVLPASAIPEAGSPRAQRMDEIVLLASDPVVNALRDAGGHYNARENVIHVDAAQVLIPSALKHIYTHEKLHASSGLTVRLDGGRTYNYLADLDPDERDELAVEPNDIEKVFENSPEFRSLIMEVERVGLKTKFKTLNEAYTEWATIQLTGIPYDQFAMWSEFSQKYAAKILTKGQPTFETRPETVQWREYIAQYGHIYASNRVIMAGLVSKGVDMKLFGEAYFESYEPKMDNPDRQPGHAAPARRALDEAVARATPYKSLEQLQRSLKLKARQVVGDSGNGSTWYEAALLAQIFNELPK